VKILSAQPLKIPATISTTEFIVKILQIFPRLPSMIFNLIKGLKSIGSNANNSWGLELERIAKLYPENVAVKSPDGFLTYRELNEKANRFAHYFISKSVGRGDIVTLCLENRPDLLAAYCGCSKVGAIASLINTNQRGESLIHSFNLNKGKVVMIGEECYDFFNAARDGIDLSHSTLAMLRDTGKIKQANITDITDELESKSAENPSTTQSVTMKDTAAYVYTSGTTGGLPKAAVIINKRTLSAMFWFGKFVMPVKPTDTIYVPLPFFHTNAITVGWPTALFNGAAVALRRKFSASKFLDDVRQFQATHFVYVGEVCRYLMAQPAKSDDHKTTLKYICGNGLRPDIWMPFKKRFGIEKVYEFYGAAEGVGIFTNFLNIDYSVGTSVTPFALVAYDTENDKPVRNGQGFMKKVGKGETGLLLMEISEKTPFAGYSDKKKTEEKIFRDVFKKGDLWFNTGDMLKNMGFRHAQFADRLGDTFRWKGENVATQEVEKYLDSFPGVSVSAVYGVTMPGSDGKAGMAAIVRDNSTPLDMSKLVEHLKSSLPKYAVPLFVRLVPDFEWTATHKIKKTNLKNQGYGPSQSKEGIYVLLPGSEKYETLYDDIYRNITAGKYKF
jgi:citronellyl-CoA synthetase